MENYTSKKFGDDTLLGIVCAATLFFIAAYGPDAIAIYKATDSLRDTLFLFVDPVCWLQFASAWVALCAAVFTGIYSYDKLRKPKLAPVVTQPTPQVEPQDYDVIHPRHTYNEPDDDYEAEIATQPRFRIGFAL